jgi:hypothetical protein
MLVYDQKQVSGDGGGGGSSSFYEMLASLKDWPC